MSPFPGQHGVTRLQKHAPAEATDGRRWTIALVVNLLGLYSCFNSLKESPQTYNSSHTRKGAGRCGHHFTRITNTAVRTNIVGWLFAVGVLEAQLIRCLNHDVVDKVLGLEEIAIIALRIAPVA